MELYGKLMRFKDCTDGKERQEVMELLFVFLMLRRANADFARLHSLFSEEYHGCEEEPENYRRHGVPFIRKELRWDSLRDGDGIARERVHGAVRELCEENSDYRELLEQKTKWQEFDDRSLNAAYDIFEDIPEGGETDDALTEVFEGLMSWAVPASVGKELEEYYSPRQIVELAAGMLRDGSPGVDLTGVDLTGAGMLGKETKETPLVTIYDPCCGSGSFLLGVADCLRRQSGANAETADSAECADGTAYAGSIRLYGQELSGSARNIAMANGMIRGMRIDMGEGTADVFVKDLHPELKTDFVVGNPPFRAKEWAGSPLPFDPRWKYGIPPKKKSSFAWVEHMLYHLKDTGKMAVILGSSTLEGGAAAEQKIRQGMIQDDIISAVLVLPQGMFYNTKISASLWIIDKKKTDECRNRILFIDGRKMGKREGSRVLLSDEEIRTIRTAWEMYRKGQYSDPELDSGMWETAAVAETDEVAEKGYSLYPARYIRKEKEALPSFDELEGEEEFLIARIRSLGKSSTETMEEIMKGFGGHTE